MTALIWEGKYDKDGKRVTPVKIPLPFQTVETVNESGIERIWCENATQLTGIPWNYIKASQKDFDKMDARDFSDITLLKWE